MARKCAPNGRHALPTPPCHPQPIPDQHIARRSRLEWGRVNLIRPGGKGCFAGRVTGIAPSPLASPSCRSHRLARCVIQNEGVLCRGGFETRPLQCKPQQTNPACRGGFETRPLYGVCQGGEMDQRTPLAFFLASFLACFFVRRDVSHLDATFLLTLPRRQNLLVDSVLRRGQLLVEADRDIR